VTNNAKSLTQSKRKFNKARFSLEKEKLKTENEIYNYRLEHK